MESINLEDFLISEIKKKIQNIPEIKNQIILIIATALSLQIETHIKGGFVRDLILAVLSEQGQKLNDNSNKYGTPYKLFTKQIKDIDLSIAGDPEIFAKELCRLAKKEGYETTEVWNNAEKTEKGRHISVWCVKLKHGIEPIDISHFRSDKYCAKSGSVKTIMVENTHLDDYRRDIPWPSIRMNDFTMVDTFRTLEYLNNGNFKICTPPLRPANVEQIINPRKFNSLVHHESVERIIRLFKYITSPYDSDFAFGWNGNSFTKIHYGGLELDHQIVKFYQGPQTKILREIKENIMLWKRNGMFASVFTAVKSAVSKRPYDFVMFLTVLGLFEDFFGLIHNMPMLLDKTQDLQQQMIKFNKTLQYPYYVLGFGCSNTELLEETLRLYSIDKISIKLTKFAKRDILFGTTYRHEKYIQPPDQIALHKITLDELTREKSPQYVAGITEHYELAKCAGYLIEVPDSEQIELRIKHNRRKAIIRAVLIDAIAASKLKQDQLIQNAEYIKIHPKFSEAIECRLNSRKCENYPSLNKIMFDTRKYKKKCLVRDVIKKYRTEAAELIDDYNKVSEGIEYLICEYIQNSC